MKINKKKFLTILLYIMTIVFIQAISHYGKIYLEGYNDLKDSMYHNFEDFGMALEDFGDELSKILILEGDDLHKEKKFMNNRALVNFNRSNFDAEDMGKGKYFDDYVFMYFQVNKVINNIVEDGNINPSEEKYLKSLYGYNEELIKEYNHIVGDVRSDWDYEKIRALEKNIVTIYNDYSLRADELLETPKYSFLKEYKGDFQEADFKRAKAYCEEVFSTLVKDQELKYDNRNEVHHDEYIFKNNEEGDPHKDLFVQKEDRADIDYQVTYNKRTNEVIVRATSYMVPPKKYSEDELDHMAKNIIAQFNQNARNYDKKKKYDSEGKLSYIRYSYIEKDKDVYDEMEKIEMDIESHGLVSQLIIMDHDDQPMILPTISKEILLSQIDTEAEIIDIFAIKDLEGKSAYVVHLKYGDTLYEAVFDGEEGRLKDYGRNIKRDYLKLSLY